MFQLRQRDPKWWEEGSRPDYRFSLANERTFLAWIRTSLAFIAGAIGVDQFATHFSTKEVRFALSAVLLIASMAIGAAAYRRWAAMERAMRNNTELPRTGMFAILSAVVLLLTATVAVAISTYL